VRELPPLRWTGYGLVVTAPTWCWSSNSSGGGPVASGLWLGASPPPGTHTPKLHPCRAHNARKGPLPSPFSLSLFLS
jgi:hypothetical protein